MYIGYIGEINGKFYFKYGLSKDVFRRDYKEHSKTFGTFEIVFIGETDNSRHVELLFEQDVKILGLHRVYKNYGREFFTVSTKYSIEYFINHMKKLIDENPLSSIIEAKKEYEQIKLNAEVEKSRLELESKKMDLQIEFMKYKSKKMDLQLEMEKKSFSNSFHKRNSDQNLWNLNRATIKMNEILQLNKKKFKNFLHHNSDNTKSDNDKSALISLHKHIKNILIQSAPIIALTYSRTKNDRLTIKNNNSSTNSSDSVYFDDNSDTSNEGNSGSKSSSDSVYFDSYSNTSEETNNKSKCIKKKTKYEDKK